MARSQHWEVKARAVERDELRLKLSDPRNERLDEFLFRAFADVRRTRRLHMP
jgi:hypothetical protein